jgi:hypothetical protein
MPCYNLAVIRGIYMAIETMEIPGMRMTQELYQLLLV